MNRPVLMSQPDSDRLTVRLAEPEDSVLCSQLDGTYQTDYVWQMHFQESEPTVRIIFNRIRLPRTMIVPYPYLSDDLQATFAQAPNLLVACYQDDILGCLDGFVEISRHAFNITNFIVHKQVRRQGIGRVLLNTAKRLALHHGCRQITMMVQTKNDPAITFVQKAGFVYCGYNDKYFQNGDIALIFSQKL